MAQLQLPISERTWCSLIDQAQGCYTPAMECFSVPEFLFTTCVSQEIRVCNSIYGSTTLISAAWQGQSAVNMFNNKVTVKPFKHTHCWLFMSYCPKMKAPMCDYHTQHSYWHKPRQSRASGAGPAEPVQLLQLVTDKYISFFFQEAKLYIMLAWYLELSLMNAEGGASSHTECVQTVAGMALLLPKTYLIFQVNLNSPRLLYFSKCKFGRDKKWKQK